MSWQDTAADPEKNAVKEQRKVAIAGTFMLQTSSQTDTTMAMPGSNDTMPSATLQI